MDLSKAIEIMQKFHDGIDGEQGSYYKRNIVKVTIEYEDYIDISFVDKKLKAKKDKENEG